MINVLLGWYLGDYKGSIKILEQVLINLLHLFLKIMN